jgi:hypothetical protein
MYVYIYIYTHALKITVFSNLNSYFITKLFSSFTLSNADCNKTVLLKALKMFYPTLSSLTVFYVNMQLCNLIPWK